MLTKYLNRNTETSVKMIAYKPLVTYSTTPHCDAIYFHFTLSIKSQNTWSNGQIWNVRDFS